MFSFLCFRNFGSSCKDLQFYVPSAKIYISAQLCIHTTGGARTCCTIHTHRHHRCAQLFATSLDPTVLIWLPNMQHLVTASVPHILATADIFTGFLWMVNTDEAGVDWTGLWLLRPGAQKRIQKRFKHSAWAATPRTPTYIFDNVFLLPRSMIDRLIYRDDAFYQWTVMSQLNQTINFLLAWLNACCFSPWGVPVTKNLMTCRSTVLRWSRQNENSWQKK